MKRVISYILTLVILFSTSVQIFAQSMPPRKVIYFKDKKGRSIELKYSPATYFEYEPYQLGKTDYDQMVAKLKDDYLNNSDEIDTNYVSDNPKVENIKQAYLDFAYYNMNPESSPLWYATAFVPGEGTAEEDVLSILDKHQEISSEIAKLFKSDPEYKLNKTYKNTMLIASLFVIIEFSYVAWAIAPEAIAVTIPATGITVTIPKFITALAIMAADIFLEESVAYEMQKLDDKFQQAKFYENGILVNVKDTRLVKSVSQKNASDLNEILERTIDEGEAAYGLTKHEGKLLKKFFKVRSGFLKSLGINLKSGYARFSDEEEKTELRIALGKVIYKICSGNEYNIHEERKQLLRTYYALNFIKAELENDSDPLRFDRAMIDLATTYKIENIQLVDGRIVGHDQNMSFEQYLVNKKGVDDSTFSRQKKFTAGDIEGILADRGIDKEDYNYELYKQLLASVKYEVPTQIGDSIKGKTNAYKSYPSMLTRAEVNYLVQLIDVNRQIENQRKKKEMERFWDDYAQQQRWQAFK